MWRYLLKPWLIYRDLKEYHQQTEQLHRARVTIAEDHRFLAADPIAALICKRHGDLVRVEWRRHGVESPVAFRDHLFRSREKEESPAAKPNTPTPKPPRQVDAQKPRGPIKTGRHWHV